VKKIPILFVLYKVNMVGHVLTR